MYLLALLLLITPLTETPNTEGKSLNNFVKYPTKFDLTPTSIADNVPGRMRIKLEPINNEYDSTVDTIHHITAKRNRFKIYQDGNRYLAYELEVNNNKVELTNSITIGMTIDELKTRFPELKALKADISTYKFETELAELTLNFKRNKLNSIHVLCYIE